MVRDPISRMTWCGRGVDGPGREHDLKPRHGILIADILHVVAWLMLSVSGLDLLEKLRNVSVITESDECLRLVSRHTT